jgi:exopolyphosphatase/guanosine-5'-triphosphate,3'-diphosphate pyrophosphatase
MNPSIAVIDIGSNSVRLMIAGTENGRVRRISKNLCTTRLAKGIDATGCLAPDRMRDTVEAIDTFCRSAKTLDVPIITYATSAVRDAENRETFVSLVRKKSGIDVRVLSGEEEGAYAFSAVTGGEGTVFDIGGGSFQIVTEKRALSFPCGCVRAKEQCDASDPQILSDKLSDWIDARAEVPSAVPQPVYGVGGTITTIGALLAKQDRFDPSGLHRITCDELDRLLQVLSGIPEPLRMKLPLLTRRGDVILQGMTILRYLMERTHTDCVIPSDRDGMEGIAEAYLNGSRAERTDGRNIG